MRKKLYLETYGCQMNVHDSEKAVVALSGAGYEPTTDPLEADLVLLNTCMVREKAARKVQTRIGELKNQFRRVSSKERRGCLPVFGVMGCVAQAEADRLFELSSEVKLVIGTQAISRLPDLVTQLEQGFPRVIDVRLSKTADFFELDAENRRTGYIASITIIEGCNKFCSFCSCPFTRGRERSRPVERIIAEAQDLNRQGYQEVHLLGQNVNSYGLSGRYHGNRGNRGNQVAGDQPASGDITFAELLRRVAVESGIPRV